MTFRNNNDQFLCSHGSKLDSSLLFRHRAESDIKSFLFQSLYHFESIPHCKTKSHAELFMGADKITGKPWDKIAPQRIDIGKFDHSLCLTGQGAYFPDACIKRFQ